MISINLINITGAKLLVVISQRVILIFPGDLKKYKSAYNIIGEIKFFKECLAGILEWLNSFRGSLDPFCHI